MATGERILTDEMRAAVDEFVTRIVPETEKSAGLRLIKDA